MSTDPGGSQPPSTDQNGASSQTAKPAAAYASSFIQKGTSTRKFAPKAARRRPAAAQNQAKASEPPASQDQSARGSEAPQDSPSEPHAAASQSEGQNNAVIGSQAPTASLPSQEHAEQSTPAIATSTVPVVATSSEPPRNPPTSTTTASNRPLTSTATPGNSTSSALPPVINTASQTNAHVAAINPSAPGNTSTVPPIDPALTSNNATAESSTTANATALQPANEGGANARAQGDGENDDGGRSPKRRRVGSAANPEAVPVVQTTGASETTPAESTTRPKAKPRAPKGQRKRKTPAEASENAEGAATTENAAAPVAKKTRKRKATGSTTQEGEGAAGEGTTAKPRKPRAPRKRKDAEDAPDGADGDDAAPKPKQKRARKAKATNAEGDNDAEGSEPKRKGRQRSTTPSDAEDHEIDPSTALMWDLARHDVHYGKLSAREKHMRGLNWDEIKERRKQREQEMAMAGIKHNQVDPSLAGAEAALNAAGSSAPGMRVNAQGEIVVDETTTNRDAYAEADRDAEALEIVEEDDYTMRITTQSFSLQNKRDPKDRIMSNRSRRWTAEATNQFYDALSMFGTDFMMISTLFPGTGRHSIKNKFTREEKDNPERVKAALLGKRTSDWNQYLQLANVNQDDFLDPDKLKAELKEEEAEMRVKIEEAAAEKAEERRQKRLAGFPDSEDEEEGGKENGKKKKKKRDKKKPFEFAPEEGVEIVEEFPEEVVIEEGGYGYDDGYDDGY